MAYIAYPIAQAKAPYGDIYHDHVPVLVTTVAEYEETLDNVAKTSGATLVTTQTRWSSPWDVPGMVYGWRRRCYWTRSPAVPKS